MSLFFSDLPHHCKEGVITGNNLSEIRRQTQCDLYFQCKVRRANDPN